MLIYQDRVNLLDRAPIEEGKLDFCRAHGIGFISFSPLAQGLLTDRYLNGISEGSRMALNASLKQSALTDELLEKLRELNRQAAERGQTLAESALAWVLEQPGVTSALVGVSGVEQLAVNLKVTARVS